MAFKNDDDILKGRELYDLIVKTFDELGYSYEEHQKDLFINSIFKGDDLAIMMFVKADEEHGFLLFDCPLAFTVEKGNEDRLLRAINEINCSIHMGAFTLSDDRIWFRYHCLPTGRLDTNEVGSLVSMVARTVDQVDGDLSKLNVKRSPVNNIMYG